MEVKRFIMGTYGLDSAINKRFLKGSISSSDDMYKSLIALLNSLTPLWKVCLFKFLHVLFSPFLNWKSVLVWTKDHTAVAVLLEKRPGHSHGFCFGCESGL